MLRPHYVERLAQAARRRLFPGARRGGGGECVRTRQRCFFIPARAGVGVNKRYVVVGAVLAVIVAFAFFMGSPMFGGFDAVR